jgi:tRNA A37 N6-isopentenylltransferase MiaA
MPPRGELHQRIEKRFLSMMDEGFLRLSSLSKTQIFMKIYLQFVVSVTDRLGNI